MSRTKFVVVVFLLASAAVQANQCSRDDECPSDGEPQNGVSLLQTKLQTNVIDDSVEDVKAHLKVEMIQAGGRQFPIDISLKDTIADLKYQIAFTAGVPRVYIELVSAGRVWKDHFTVGSYGPRDADIVHASMMGSSSLFSATPVTAPAAAAPKMFVAVFTARSASAEKRTTIRELWSEVDAGSGNICARFVICKGSDPYQQSLLAEHAAHGDFLFLDCAEGYAQGLLTKKLILVLREYRDADNAKDACLNRPLFTKVDDDTFVAARSFRQGFSLAAAQYGTNFTYAGVASPAGQYVIRQVSNPWYEPVYPQPTFPPGMYGGPGYTLGRELVRRIIDENVASSNVLWNEDRAVAVWVNILETKGAPVSWVRIPGTNGYQKEQSVDSGTWGTYPYTLHHHLSEACISCLTMLDQTNNDTALVDPCFLQNALWQKH